jgi:hypothetical protein
MSDWKDNKIYIVIGRTMCGGAAMLGAGHDERAASYNAFRDFGGVKMRAKCHMRIFRSFKEVLDIYPTWEDSVSADVKAGLEVRARWTTWAMDHVVHLHEKEI